MCLDTLDGRHELLRSHDINTTSFTNLKRKGVGGTDGRRGGRNGGLGRGGVGKVAGGSELLGNTG